MGETMFAQCHDQLVGGLGKKRPHPHMMTVGDEREVDQMRKAMRAAMLKARFAGTILKATVELQGGNTSDVSSLQQQIKAAEAAASQYEELKKQKARNEAQIKAAEAAAQRKAQHDLKKRREAARIALQKVEKSAWVDEDAASIMRDFEKLIGLPSGTGLGYPNTKPLERRQQAQDDVEEGEIVC